MTLLITGWSKQLDELGAAMLALVRRISKRGPLQNTLRKSTNIYQSTLNGLSAHITVVDAAGEIVLVNKSYKDFAEANGIASALVCEHANYFSVCNAAQGHDCEYAHAFAQGLQDVMSGKYPLFELEYPCHSPDEQRWFIVRVTVCPYQVSRLFIVAHENITARKQSELSLAESQAAALSERSLAQASSLKLMTDAVAARHQAETLAAALAEQLDELRRLQMAMLDREDRIIGIKQEVNALLAQLDQPPRYANQLQTDGVLGVGKALAVPGGGA